MTRGEYNEFRYIRSSLKKFTLGHGTTVTVRTDAGADYKHRLDDLYTSLNFHPASIRRDPRMYDEKERIIYIFDRTWTDNEGRERPWTDNEGRERPWTELYTPEERASFAAALD